MSAPMLWIVFPGAAAGLMLVLRRWTSGVAFIGTAVALFLAWAAWRLPIGEPLGGGALSAKIAGSLVVLGRNFTLTEGDRPFLTWLFLTTAFWLLGAVLARPGNLFAPLALGMVALLTAALAVEPFLYAALLIEITALLSVPMLVPPGSSPGRGVFRFLSFQTLGMPFILFTGWMLAGVEASPGNLQLVLRAGVLLGLGFAFLLAIFPFHSWIPMLAEESHPYVAAFLFLMLPGVVSLFGAGFFDRFIWLRDSQQAYDLLRVIGALMILAGGWWAAFQSHLGRMLGFAVVLEIGYACLALGLGTAAGVELLFALLLPRSFALLVWGIALSAIRPLTGNDLGFSAVRGLGLRVPWLVGALVLAHFTLAGLPLLAAFPVRFALWGALAADHPLIAAGAILGSVGLLAGGLRTLAALVGGELEQRLASHRLEASPEDLLDAGPAGPPATVAQEVSDPLEWAFYSFTLLVLLGIGLWPQLFFPMLANLPGMFPQLAP